MTTDPECQRRTRRFAAELKEYPRFALAAVLAHAAEELALQEGIALRDAQAHIRRAARCARHPGRRERSGSRLGRAIAGLALRLHNLGEMIEYGERELRRLDMLLAGHRAVAHSLGDPESRRVG